jgi:DNA-binding NarL/FixJ family response regulator
MTGQGTQAAAILVVEDEWITARDIQETLAALGHRVTGLAASAAAALESIEADRPDLVLMDIRLEGPIDGIEVAREIRRRWDIPVVYLTAHRDQPTVDRLKDTRPAGFVSKPFDEAQLRVAVDLALHNAADDRDLRERARRADELDARSAALEERLRQVAFLVQGSDAAAPTRLQPAGADARQRFEALTRREAEVVTLVARGRRVSAIARDLEVSVFTVRNHLRSAFKKLDVHSQEELVEMLNPAKPGKPRG